MGSPVHRRRFSGIHPALLFRESSDTWSTGPFRSYPFLQFLVYSGSTAVGHYAVQLAHLSGYKVIATASQKNHDTLKSLGADVVFNVRIS